MKVILFVALISALITFSLLPFDGGDNYAYWFLSQSLVTGNGYREIQNPENTLHGHFPPMLPILLIPSALLNNYHLSKVTIFLFFVGTIILFMKFIAKEPKAVKYTALALFAISPVLWEYSHYVLSEMPFLFFSLLAIYLWRNNQLIWAHMSALTAFYVRSIGIVLVVVIIIFYILDCKRWKWSILRKIAYQEAIKKSIIFVILTIPWFIWSHKYNTCSYWPLIHPSLFFINLRYLITDIMQKFYYISILPMALMVLGVWHRKKEWLQIAYIGLYIGVILCWKFGWDYRMYIPMLPFFALYMAEGLIYISKKICKGYAIANIMMVIYCLFGIATVLHNPVQTWRDNRIWLKHKVLPNTRQYGLYNIFLDIDRQIKDGKIDSDAEFRVPKAKAFYYFTNKKAYTSFDGKLYIMVKGDK